MKDRIMKRNLAVFHSITAGSAFREFWHDIFAYQMLREPTGKATKKYPFKRQIIRRLEGKGKYGFSKGLILIMK